MRGCDQRRGAGVDAADMAEQQIARIDRLAAHLRIEVEAARREAALLEDEIERRHELGRVVGELVGVPAGLIVVAVGVDGTEHPERRRERDLMLEGMVRQHRMADFDIELDLALEAEALQEAEHGRDVEVVLMLGRLLRLGLDQDHALEADLVLVVDDQRQKAPELLLLATQVGVEQRFVALAAAP